MHVVSVQRGDPRPLTTVNGDETSGIDKRPEPMITVGTNGVDGDTIIDVDHHGGPDQAVYVYSNEDYAWWEKELDRSLPPGSFGENVTLDSFGSAEVRIGDRFRMGDVELEVTAPRIPCNTLSAHIGIPTFVQAFKQSRRPGFYARVITPGTIEAGVSVDRVDASPDFVSLLEVQDLYYDHKADRDRIERAAASPVASRTMDSYRRRLSTF